MIPGVPDSLVDDAAVLLRTRAARRSGTRSRTLVRRRRPGARERQPERVVAPTPTRSRSRRRAQKLVEQFNGYTVGDKHVRVTGDARREPRGPRRRRAPGLRGVQEDRPGTAATCSSTARRRRSATSSATRCRGSASADPPGARAADHDRRARARVPAGERAGRERPSSQRVRREAR